jgi:5-methylcytosine-specific restriction endonuclease McrA
MASEIRFPDRSQHKRPEKVQRRTSRQKRQRQTRDEQYLALRDIYLEENPACCSCGGAACEVHHICRGVNRGKSLLNPDTWLSLCGDCHRQMDKTTIAAQVRLKESAVRYAIERLRK